MRIAILVGAFPTVSETFVLNQVTGLIDRGHDVHVFAARQGQRGAIHSEVTKYDLLTRVHLPEHEMRPNGRGSLRVVPTIAEAVLSRPGDAWKLGKIARIGGLAAAYRFMHDAALLRDMEPFDVLLCHFGHNGRRAAYLREADASTAPIVTFFHGADVSRFIEKAGPRVYDHLFQTGDLFLPISEYWRDRLAGLGCPEGKMAVHRMGVDTSKFEYRRRSRANDEPLRLITVARLIEKKGIEFAIRAVAEVVKTAVKVDYTIVGDGQLRHELEDLVHQYGLGEYIHLVGQRSQDDVVRALDAAHVMVAPSITAANGDMEGIPVALMEAMVSGLIVVSTRHSGIPELIEDGTTGYLVPERDVSALAERFTLLAASDQAWPRITAAARRFVLSQHDINMLNDQLVNRLEMAVNARQGSRVS